MARLAHSFRGISLTLGMVELGSKLRDIEDLAEAGDEARLTPLLELLPAVAAQAQTDLRHWLEARPRASGQLSNSHDGPVSPAG